MSTQSKGESINSLNSGKNKHPANEVPASSSPCLTISVDFLFLSMNWQQLPTNPCSSPLCMNLKTFKAQSSCNSFGIMCIKNFRHGRQENLKHLPHVKPQLACGYFLGPDSLEDCLMLLLEQNMQFFGFFLSDLRTEALSGLPTLDIILYLVDRSHYQGCQWMVQD